MWPHAPRRRQWILSRGDRCDETLDRIGQVSAGEERSQEQLADPVHQRHQQIVAVAKVHVKGATGVPRPSADAIEARLQPFTLDGGDAGGDERLARLGHRVFTVARHAP
jgi:hypothetical protein